MSSMNNWPAGLNYKLYRNTFNIALEKECLAFWLNDKTKYNIYFTSNTDFLMLEMEGSEIKFTKDKNNKITGFDIDDKGDKMQANIWLVFIRLGLVDK